MKPIKMPIEDILDLHTFQPKEIPNLFDDYFAACIEKTNLLCKSHSRQGKRHKERVWIINLNDSVLLVKLVPLVWLVNK